jgi:phosphoribosylaminoimidazole-succinocarboxamide synthase
MSLLSIDIPGLPAPKGSNKVRQTYDLGSEMLLVTTDRISAFDVVMENGIPDKGRVLNLMSAFWFEKFADICPNHVITIDDQTIASQIGLEDRRLFGRTLLAKKAKPLKIECVARGYITGSLYKEYLTEGGKVHGLDLPEGLVDSDKLPEPIFTPATKAETGHDENLSEAQARDLVGSEVYDFVKNVTLKIYTAASEFAASKGIILADTKFEFGETEDGIIWIDEALTPDSSRFWPADQYEPGKQQPSYDKQFVRNYLEEINFNKMPPGPRLPEEIVEKTRSRYIEAYEKLVGKPFIYR